MTNLDSILKSRDITLPTKTHLVKAIVFQWSCMDDPMNRSTPGIPIHHQLPEFTETHVHRVSDAIQPSHPLSSTLARDGVSREVPCSALKGETVPDSLPATRKSSPL